MAITINAPRPFTGMNAAAVGSDGKVEVQIDDGGSTNTMEARVYVFPRGSTSETDPEGTTTVPAPTSGTSRTARVTVGTIDPSVMNNNRRVEVEDIATGDVVGNAFRADPGSGSGSDGGGGEIFRFCKPGQQVSTVVLLKLDSKVSKGTCAKCADLNAPTKLYHSKDHKLAGQWFSQPIAFCGKGAPPGYWVLHKNSATAWTLTLRQDKDVLVTFTAKTKPKDCSLPVKLLRKGAGSKVCKDWPKSVTISAAK